MAGILEVDGLTKAYGADVQVLGGITLAARKGEFLSVVGPSGCGKTTLLLSLAGLIRADGGTVRFNGGEVRGETPPGLAIVFQDYSRSLMPWKTNLSNVVFGMRRVKARSTADKTARAKEILGAVGLGGFEDKYPWQLSGGMQQRVAIARGIASQSELLLLDEPLAAVDAQTRSDMQDLLLQLAQRFNQTCLLVTHDVDEAVYMADRVVVLSNRPSKVVREIEVNLPKPRDQIATRELAAYLSIRHEVLGHIRSMRQMSGAL